MHIKKSYILHQKILTSCIFITSKYYILNKKIIHLTPSSHIKNIILEKSYMSHRKILQLVYKSYIVHIHHKILNLTPYMKKT